MRKGLVVAVVVLALAGGWWWRARAGAAAVTAQGGADAGPTAPPFSGVVAEGVVVPVRYASLSLPLGGTVEQVLVKEGQAVKQGDVLVVMDRRELVARLEAARAEVGRAQALLRQAKAQARPEELEVKLAQRDQVRQELERARKELARLSRLKAQAAVSEQDLERGEAAVEGAQARLGLVEADIRLMQAGARAEAVAVAEAGVATARAAVSQVEAALALAQLRAPADGTVVYVELRAGEYAPPSLPVIRIADTSRFLIHTDDLTELAVVKVKEGASAEVTLDAVPGLTLQGTVAHIRPFGERKKGDMTYTVVVDPGTQDPRLRWNMTASVRIATAESTPHKGGDGGVDLGHLTR